MVERMKLSKNNMKRLMIEMNRAIDEITESVSKSIVSGNYRTDYPPNGGLTKDEEEVLLKIKVIPNVESTLRKIIADSAAYPLFELFCLIDQVTDLDNSDDWSGVALVDYNDSFEESDDMDLHDAFYDNYWEWLKERPTKDWKLDNWK